MASEVLRIVLAFAVDMVDGLRQDSRAVPAGSFAVGDGVFNPDLNDVRVVGGDVALSNRYASTSGSHLDSVVGDAETDCESEGGAKPVGCNARVGINENRNDGARRHGTVEEHGDNLTGSSDFFFWRARRTIRPGTDFTPTAHRQITVLANYVAIPL